jgi:hypothetical protein
VEEMKEKTKLLITLTILLAAVVIIFALAQARVEIVRNYVYVKDNNPFFRLYNNHTGGDWRIFVDQQFLFIQS